MVFFLDYRYSQFKQQQRADRIASLSSYHGPLTDSDRETVEKPIERLVAGVHNGIIQPLDILRTYGKVALKAHEKTNCLTEILLPDAERWLQDGSSINLKGPLAGVPVSLKDTIVVGGYDATVGYSSFVGNAKQEDGVLVRLLKDAGAVPYVKTNIPISLLSFESTNDVWGRSTNPHNPKYSPGGSTGGESALLALGGRIGIGSDVAGSIEQGYSEKKRLRIGMLRTDGVVDPSPACTRALKIAEQALAREGHEIVEINPPDMYHALKLGSVLLNADGCRTFKSFMRSAEWEDKGANQMSWYMRLPRPFKWVYYLWVKFIRRDDVWAGLVRDWHAKTAEQNWKLVAERELYRAQWFEWWNQTEIDFILSPPNATPAVPHDGMKDALDYTAGIVPVTHVDKALDGLPAGFNIKKLNGVAQGAYKLYNAEAMHGLPVGVQVVGRRLEEEKVLAAMKRLEDALGDEKYDLLAID
ncbi:putative fatty-acid amide hydrolase [Diaporthe ampelina]|uniref:Putative fatty-acid amide hydrolase n=1 Tax=Diaporthe ampelina TaxID=1214573 RepID=A0A0G2FN14_9PEZI|nr:putative fatty-acid amide hydrolase [Diaporthe ampelina]